MDELASQHSANKAQLEQIESGLSPSAPPAPAPAPAAVPNPLLSRGKLKPAKKSKPKPKSKKELAAAEVEKIRAAELGVVSASIGHADHGVADGEEGEVLDLADRLLEQLHTQEQAERATEEPPAASAAPEPARAPAGAAPVSKSGSSSHNSLQDFKDDMLGMLHLGGHGHGPTGEKKVSRQQARKLRKVEKFDQAQSDAHAEVAAANDTSIADERKCIDEGCKKLGVWVKEIEPDGHCLYSAIADQINTMQLTLDNRKETYMSVRSYASQYMRAHPDDFLPFLETPEDRLMTPAEYEDYCHTVEKTGEWGGQPEIIALSKYFRAPIHVLQAGTDIVKTGEDLPPGRGPILLSYHRKMYGLGEHYNSLRR